MHSVGNWHLLDDTVLSCHRKQTWSVLPTPAPQQEARSQEPQELPGCATTLLGHSLLHCNKRLLTDHEPDRLIIFSVPSDPNSVYLSFVTCIYFVAILLRLFSPIAQATSTHRLIGRCWKNLQSPSHLHARWGRGRQDGQANRA